MTYLEKYRADHPGTDGPEEEEIVQLLCPQDLGYEELSPCISLLCYPEETEQKSCRKCWGRKMTE